MDLENLMKRYICRVPGVLGDTGHTVGARKRGPDDPCARLSVSCLAAEERRARGVLRAGGGEGPRLGEGKRRGITIGEGPRGGAREGSRREAPRGEQTGSRLRNSVAGGARLWECKRGARFC